MKDSKSGRAEEFLQVDQDLSMASPFPGMDPYLEGYLWPDMDSGLAAKIRQFLTPRLRPRYTARLNVYVVEDITPEGEIGILYPDVEIMRAQRSQEPDTTEHVAARAGSEPITPAAMTIPVMIPVEVHVPGIEIRDTAQNQLITAIEILSPVNKREPGLSAYRMKRHRLYQAGVHLLELDLLRRGTRPLLHANLPDAPYLITLTRAQASVTQVWPLRLQDSWPTLPIPLRAPDADSILDLGVVFREVYEEAAYDLSIDYRQDPPGLALNDAEKSWLRGLLGQA